MVLKLMNRTHQLQSFVLTSSSSQVWQWVEWLMVVVHKKDEGNRIVEKFRSRSADVDIFVYVRAGTNELCGQRTHRQLWCELYGTRTGNTTTFG